MLQNSFFVVMDKILMTYYFIRYTTKPSEIDMNIRVISLKRQKPHFKTKTNTDTSSNNDNQLFNHHKRQMYKHGIVNTPELSPVNF